MTKRILLHLFLTLGLASAPMLAGSPARAQEGAVYHAIYNDEWQYSIWPVDRDLPPPWRLTGFKGSKSEVLHFINQVWTDMRPWSLRKIMDPTDRCILADQPPHLCRP